MMPRRSMCGGTAASEVVDRTVLARADVWRSWMGAARNGTQLPP